MSDNTEELDEIPPGNENDYCIINTIEEKNDDNWSVKFKHKYKLKDEGTNEMPTKKQKIQTEIDSLIEKLIKITHEKKTGEDLFNAVYLNIEDYDDGIAGVLKSRGVAIKKLPEGFESEYGSKSKVENMLMYNDDLYIGSEIDIKKTNDKIKEWNDIHDKLSKNRCHDYRKGGVIKKTGRKSKNLTKSKRRNRKTKKSKRRVRKTYKK